MKMRSNLGSEVFLERLFEFYEILTPRSIFLLDSFE